MDILNTVVFPVSSGVLSIVIGTSKTLANYIGLQPKKEVKMQSPIPLWQLAASSGPYLTLAAISGATAVILGAYGSHKLNAEKTPDQVKVFETANRYHFIHTLALLGLPLCRRPFFPAVFFLSGLILFSGSCYYAAFTNDRSFSKVTPIGGTCFILGWLSMLL